MGCAQELLVSPHLLVQHSIPVVRVVQYPGEFIINYPGAHLLGFSYPAGAAQHPGRARGAVPGRVHHQLSRCAHVRVQYPANQGIALMQYPGEFIINYPGAPRAPSRSTATGFFLHVVTARTLSVRLRSFFACSVVACPQCWQSRSHAIRKRLIEKMCLEFGVVCCSKWSAAAIVL